MWPGQIHLALHESFMSLMLVTRPEVLYLQPRLLDIKCSQCLGTTHGIFHIWWHKFMHFYNNYQIKQNHEFLATAQAIFNQSEFSNDNILSNTSKIKLQRKSYFSSNNFSSHQEPLLADQFLHVYSVDYRVFQQDLLTWMATIHVNTNHI